MWVIALVIAVLTATRLPKARVRSWPGWLLAAALLVVLVNRVVVRQIPSALRQVGDYETAEVAALASFWCAHVPSLLLIAFALVSFRLPAHLAVSVEREAPGPPVPGRSEE